MDAGGRALKPLKQQQSSTGSGRRVYPGTQADLQRGFGKMNFNFLCGTSAKDRTSTFPSAGHTLRLCQSNLPWLSLDSTSRRNHLPKQETQNTFSKFLEKCNFRYIWNISLTINPPNLCFLISKYSSLSRQSCFMLRKRNILLENNKVLWLLSVRWKRRSGNSSSWNLVCVLIQTEIFIYGIINRWGSLLSQMF